MFHQILSKFLKHPSLPYIPSLYSISIFHLYTMVKCQIFFSTLLVAQIASCASIVEAIGDLSLRHIFHVDPNSSFMVPSILAKNYTAAMQAFKKYPFSVKAWGTLDSEPILFLRSFKDKTIYQVKERLRSSRHGEIYRGINVLNGKLVDLRKPIWNRKQDHDMEFKCYALMNQVVGVFIDNYLPLHHFRGGRTLAMELGDRNSKLDPVKLYEMARSQLILFHSRGAVHEGPNASDFIIDIDPENGQMSVHLTNLGFCQPFSNLEPITHNFVSFASSILETLPSSSTSSLLKRVKSMALKDLTNPPNLDYFGLLADIRRKEIDSLPYQSK